jgi:hypothetical protein
MSMNTAWTELNNGIKTVTQAFQIASEEWKDAVARDFETNHWGPLHLQVLATLQAMDLLGPILMQAQRDCSDRGD